MTYPVIPVTCGPEGMVPTGYVYGYIVLGSDDVSNTEKGMDVHMHNVWQREVTFHGHPLNRMALTGTHRSCREKYPMMLVKRNSKNNNNRISISKC